MPEAVIVVALACVTAFLAVGALVLLRARDHLEADAAKIFEAVLKAMQEQQERDEAKKTAAAESLPD